MLRLRLAEDLPLSLSTHTHTHTHTHTQSIRRQLPHPTTSLRERDAEVREPLFTLRLELKRPDGGRGSRLFSPMFAPS